MAVEPPAEQDGAERQRPAADEARTLPPLRVKADPGEGVHLQRHQFRVVAPVGELGQPPLGVVGGEHRPGPPPLQPVLPVGTQLTQARRDRAYVGVGQHMRAVQVVAVLAEADQPLEEGVHPRPGLEARQLGQAQVDLADLPAERLLDRVGGAERNGGHGLPAPSSSLSTSSSKCTQLYGSGRASYTSTVGSDRQNGSAPGALASVCR